MKDLKKQIKSAFDEAKDKLKFLNEIREFLHELSPVNAQPVDLVRWVPIDKVQPNDYNPNSVARTEMKLLHTSISHDGYTQPIVTIYDEKLGKYIIVDGFHRYFVALNNKDIYDSNLGMVPVTVIKKDINDRMASTVRHNRARGKHSISGMSSMVFNMLDNGWEDAAICNELGMEPEELLKLKHITGFSKLFKNTEYSRSWVTKHQILIQKEFANEKQE
jgi:ParB-like chromosome segregation protein Spo0J